MEVFGQDLRFLLYKAPIYNLYISSGQSMKNVYSEQESSLTTFMMEEKGFKALRWRK
jgi:hypothetical protein